MTKYKHSLQNQNISLKDTLIDSPRNDRGVKNSSAILLLVIGVVMGMFFITAVKSCEKKSEPIQLVCIQCHNWAASPPLNMESYRKYMKLHAKRISDNQTQRR